MDSIQLQIEQLRTKFVPGWLNVVQVDEGWYGIVLNCDKELSELDPDYRVHQIKEKFGGLRYYFRHSDECSLDTLDKMNQVVQKYEAESFRICEATGEPGVLMRSAGGYLKTLNPVFVAGSGHHARYTEAALKTSKHD